MYKIDRRGGGPKIVLKEINSVLTGPNPKYILIMLKLLKKWSCTKLKGGRGGRGFRKSFTRTNYFLKLFHALIQLSRLFFVIPSQAIRYIWIYAVGAVLFIVQSQLFNDLMIFNNLITKFIKCFTFFLRAINGKTFIN